MGWNLTCSLQTYTLWVQLKWCIKTSLGSMKLVHVGKWSINTGSHQLNFDWTVKPLLMYTYCSILLNGTLNMILVRTRHKVYYYHMLFETTRHSCRGDFYRQVWLAVQSTVTTEIKWWGTWSQIAGTCTLIPLWKDHPWCRENDAFPDRWSF